MVPYNCSFSYTLEEKERTLFFKEEFSATIEHQYELPSYKNG